MFTNCKKFTVTLTALFIALLSVVVLSGNVKIPAQAAAATAATTEEEARQGMFEIYSALREAALNPEFDVDYERLPIPETYDYAATPEIVAKVQEITNGLTTDKEKAIAVYRWIGDNIYYDYDYIKDYNNGTFINSADVFREKRTVCEGYSKLYITMCRSAGVPCRLVFGLADAMFTTRQDFINAYNKRQVNHAWNEVYFDGTWHTCDVTWDSSNQYYDGTFHKISPCSLRYMEMPFKNFTEKHCAMSYPSHFMYRNFITSVSYSNDKINISTYKYTGTETIVTIPALFTNLSGGVFQNSTTVKKVIIPSGIPYIPADFAKDSTSLEEVIIPDTVKSINYNAFTGCTGLKQINLPAGLEEISWEAFMGSGLTSVVIPDSVKTVNYSAFANCPDLVSIKFPSGIEDLPGNVIKGSTALQSVDFGGKIKVLKTGIFDGMTALKTVKGLESVETMGDNCFKNCSSLESIAFGNKLKKLGFDTFRGCTSLTSVTGLDAVETVGTQAFLDCTALTRVDFGGKVKTISKNAFWGCSELTEVTGLENTEIIGGLAFYECPKLISIGGELPVNLKSVGAWAFGNLSQLKLNAALPVNLTTVGTCAFYNSGLTGDLIIPSGTAVIEEYAFGVSSGITTITIPKSVTEIKKAGLQNNQATDIYYEGSEADWNKIIIGELNPSLNSSTRHYNCNHKHQYESSVTKQPTCQETGIKTFTCTICGESYEETIAKLAHTPGSWVIDIEPTCKEAGSKHQVCSVCGETIKTETIVKLNHKPETIPAAAPTCTKTGLTEGKRCSVCGEILVPQQTVSKLPHTPGSWVIDIEPTCKEAGSKHQVCSVCGETIKTETIVKLNHTPETIPAAAPTCSKTGLTDGKRCAVCGEILVPQKTVPKLPHTPGEWIVDREPTCAAAGSRHKECTVCGEITVTEEIAKLDHIPEIIPAVAPSCTKEGSTEGLRCSVCGEIIKAPEKLGKTAHTDADGNKICDVCGADLTPHCNHICHSTNPFLQFIWKIVNFFNKLFKINQYCECGARHW